MGNCPGGSCPCGSCPSGESSWWGVVHVENCPEGGSSSWELSIGELS